MRITRTTCAILLCLVLAQTAWGAVEGRTLWSISAEGTPLDVAISADGQTICVLTDRNEVLILALDGTVKDRLALDEPADSIALSPRGEAIILTSRDKKTARTVLLEFVRTISVGDAPFRGPQNAPVTIAVFTDFQ